MKLFLQIQIGGDAYLLEAAQIVCVLPLMDIKSIPGAPVGIAGVFNYHGTPVPLVDVSQLMLGQSAPRHLSTRIILVPYEQRLLGLLASQVTETVRCDPAYFFPAGVSMDAARYLGPVTMVGSRLLQLIEVPELLPPQVSEALFREAAHVWSASA